MAYSTCAQVAALIPNLLNGASSFDGLDAAIRPSSAQLVTFMSSGCALIEVRVQSLGYSVPLSGGLGTFAGDLEANFAAYRAELSRSSPRTAAGERSRADGFRKVFDDGLKMLADMDLSRAAGDYTSKFYAGGISEDDKDTVESDTDRVAPRFFRDVFDGDFATSAS
jgi:hypothetical protein